MKTKKSLFEQNGAHIRRLAMCSFQTYLSERWNRDLSGNMYSLSRHTTTVRTVRYTAVPPVQRLVQAGYCSIRPVRLLLDMVIYASEFARFAANKGGACLIKITSAVIKRHFYKFLLHLRIT